MLSRSKPGVVGCPSEKNKLTEKRKVDRPHTLIKILTFREILPHVESNHDILLLQSLERNRNGGEGKFEREERTVI